MRTIVCLALATALSLFSLQLTAASDGCLTCHNDEDGSPIHALLESKHGRVAEACEACHGPSTEHRGRPTETSPDISFGPRWTATVAQQDEQCLACHQDDVAAHWQDALHMANNITCVGCHDSHTVEDPALNPKTQADVCTTCHKTQKAGIHGKERMRKMNPPCTTCHNPHADQRPVTVMMANDSQGCRRCHKLPRMEKSDKVSAKAKSYHRSMSGKELTCISCHQGVAHGATDAVEPFLPLPTEARDVTLFYPGQSDADWILSEHKGSQPVRQGSNCQQCHRGDEADMGAALGTEDPTSRVINTSFRAEDDRLIMTLAWQGEANDADIALMWGYGVNDAFRRGGCWAACHSDMNGMTADRGVKPKKYLNVSRAQKQRIGAPTLIKDKAALSELMSAGNFVELWRVDLQKKGKVEVSALLSGLDKLKNTNISATATHKDGMWSVTLQRPLRPDAPLQPLDLDRAYTFGMALHGKGRAGADHWVSLPMTFSMDRDDTDFRAD
jgi:predicted CXXCH cytochrome family protein